MRNFFKIRCSVNIKYFCCNCRRKPGAGDAEFASPSDIGSEGGAFSEEENAANEFGDIDERHRPTASGSSKRLRGRRGGLRNKKPRRYDESGSDEEDDGEHAVREKL